MADKNLNPSGSSSGLTPFGRDPFVAFRREIDRLFDDFFSPASNRASESPGFVRGGWPSIDVDEMENAYKVTAEVPGLEEKDIDVNLRDNVLTINGERRKVREEKEENRTYSERFYGRFHRTIPFATEVDADKVEATFKSGVLTVTLPKNPKAQEKTRRISIKSGA
jgi:HSP20 family protein